LTSVQQVNDEIRLFLDTIETEILSGSEFSTFGYCGDGSCKGINFRVRTREDTKMYQVEYQLRSDGRVWKGTQRTDGVCSPDILDAACWFPVTSEHTTISVLNFNVTFDTALPPHVPQQPAITMSLVGETTTETGDVLNISRTATYAPRTRIAMDSIQQSDNVVPSVRFNRIERNTPLDCIVSDRADLSTAYPMIEWAENTPPFPVYTNCETVNIEFYAIDRESGLKGVRYDGDSAVQGGDCIMGCKYMGMRTSFLERDRPAQDSQNYCPCSEAPRGMFSMQTDAPQVYMPGFAGEALFRYEGVQLRPGVHGRDGLPPQIITLSAKDMVDNVSDSVRLSIYTTTEYPLTTAGMLGIGRWFCLRNGSVDFHSLVVPREDNYMPQQVIRHYECDSTVAERCPPSLLHRHLRGGGGREYLWLYTYVPSDQYRWYTDDGAENVTSGNYSIRRTSPSWSRYYRFGFTVYNPYDGAESEMQIIEMDRAFSQAMTPRRPANAGGVWNDSGTSASTPLDIWAPPYTIAKIPADYVFADTSTPTTDDTSSGGGETLSIGGSRQGHFSAGVTGGGGFTSAGPVRVSHSGAISPVTIELYSHPSGVTMFQSSYTLTSSTLTANVSINVPNNIEVGIAHTVVLRLTGGGQTQLLSIPLNVSYTGGDGGSN
jgi:hypothetical protein